MAKIAFVTEARFYKNENGVFFADSSFSTSLWLRYLSNFSEIVVFARVKKIKGDPDGKFVSSCKGVSFVELPWYIGPHQLFLKFLVLCISIRRGINNNKESIFVLRVPGVIGFLTSLYLNRLNISYAVEVVGDPGDVFSEGAYKHLFRIALRVYSVRLLKYCVQNAAAALYVTKSTLQRKYKPSANAYVVSASDVMLPNASRSLLAKVWVKKDSYSVVAIGSLEQLYKSPDILLHALKIVKSILSDVSIKLTWLGGGHYQKDMQLLAHKLGVNDAEFLGNVSRAEVLNYLDRADLFVLPSRTEGLPRAVIEAMAKGLPVIGTNVGGIPELLDHKALVEKNNPKMLALKIIEIIQSEELYNSQAEINFNNSAEYTLENLNAKRDAFYSGLSNHISTLSR